MYKSTGKKPQGLIDLIEMPFELAYLYDWFFSLFPLPSLTFSEIYYWGKLNNLNLKGWEANFLISTYEEVKKELLGIEAKNMPKQQSKKNKR